MAVLLDTCILSPFFSKKGPPDKLFSWFHGQETLAISVVTHFEIEMGLRGARLDKVVGLYFELLELHEIAVLDFTAKQSQLAALQGSKMKKLGKVYALQDLWIGACAREQRMQLATANTKDFDHWEGLVINNPLN